MTQEDKELLLKDLCERLPYGVKGKCEIDASYDTSFDTIYQLHKFDATLDDIKEDLLFVTPLIEDNNEQEFANEEVAEGIDILDFKPYLRPMSSMTNEDLEDYQKIRMIDFEHGDIDGTFINSGLIVDWLLKNHFDFRGLIPKGLAIADTLEMKEVDLEKELDTWRHNHFHGRRDKDVRGEYLERSSQLDIAKHFFELGLKAQKVE